MPAKRKGAGKKKGKKVVRGTAAQFMTRNQALRKLQLTLPEFRKLCILKGIYPREPRTAPYGKDKTYYLRKDVMYVLHDPLLPKMREYRAWKKKVKKYKDKKMPDKVNVMRKHKPRYSLTHLIRERYPTFQDALRDLDDVLSTVVLFSTMPSTVKIHASRVEHCARLMREFEYYCVQTHALRKVFVAQRGIYYQVEIGGIPITWVAPHQFTQKIVKDVDYKVMMTFLEFYELLMSFVNYKLYQSINMTYPPPIDPEKEANDEGLSAIVQQMHNEADAASSLRKVPERKGPVTGEEKAAMDASRERMRSLKSVLPNIAQNEEESDEKEREGEGESDEEDELGDSVDIDDEMSEDEEDEEEDEKDEESNSESGEEGVETTWIEQETLEADDNPFAKIFAGCLVWLSREVPLRSLDFVIRACGGKTAWAGHGQVDESDARITHHVMDRPTIAKVYQNRDYVQPQWVYDSVNTVVRTPPHAYTPGEKLPPHLSPFVDDEAEGYVPEYRKVLDSYYEAAHGKSRRSASAPVLPLDESADEAEESEDEYAAGVAAEAEGKYQQPERNEKKKSKKRQREEAEVADQTEAAAALLPNKKRKLLERIKYSKRMKQEEIDKLERKKAALEQGEAKIAENVIEYSKQ